MVNSELVIDFVNSVDLRPFKEELDSPAALSRWLAGRGLVASGARVSREELAEAIRVREAIRDLLAAQ